MFWAFIMLLRLSTFHFYLLLSSVFPCDYITIWLFYWWTVDLFLVIMNKGTINTFWRRIIYLFLAVSDLSCSMWDLSSQTRDWTHVSCIARWILSHWITTEVPLWTFLCMYFCVCVWTYLLIWRWGKYLRVELLGL